MRTDELQDTRLENWCRVGGWQLGASQSKKRRAVREVMQICERQTNKVEKERDRVSISLGKFPRAKMIKRWPWQYACLMVNTRYGFASDRVICRLRVVSKGYWWNHNYIPPRSRYLIHAQHCLSILCPVYHVPWSAPLCPTLCSKEKETLYKRMITMSLNNQNAFWAWFLLFPYPKKIIDSKYVCS
jgi:hypothetical protein